jgi:putative flippase GtrA
MSGMMELVRQSVRFGMVGVVNTALGLSAIYALMFFLGAGPALANFVGYGLGLAVSFALNRVWTFSSTLPVAHVLPKYLLVAAICYLLNLGAVIACTSYLSANPYLAQLVGVGIYTVSMFLSCRWFVFAPRHSATQTPT